ncbi:hypothetical protein DL95DRAFT_407760 [Leptodontidium sp. 2 PMI_412]|nr:hypothetical protein DL95DRAFT_407760 [Leptodontidium sp. 2 PMI_412]
MMNRIASFENTSSPGLPTSLNILPLGNPALTACNKMKPLTGRWASYTPESIKASSCASDLEPLRTFHPFTRLPTEIRSLIYEFASPPQLIYTHCNVDRISRSYLTIDTDALRDQDEHMKEQFANVATFIRDHISFYFRPNPLLSVSKEARERLFTREKLYEFDRALCDKKTLYEFNCGHKVTVKAFPTESHEHDMVEKAMVDLIEEDEDPLEYLLLNFTGLKEIIFNYDGQFNTDNLPPPPPPPPPPPWMTVEDVIEENMWALKKKHKDWRVPNFWVVRKTKKRQLLRQSFGECEENKRMFGIDLF